MTAIEVRNVAKTFKAGKRTVVAVDKVSFSVPEGGVLGVVGESGCGKSTLARLILGLLRPDSGDIAVEGQRVLDMDRKARARLIQPVFQDPFASLNPRRQRVAIARALVLRPRIVVCDEPTSALDVSVQAQILNLLSELRRDLGLTYLFISHNLAVVEHVASEVAVMYLGRFVESAPTERLFGRPEHPYTKALLASVLTPEPGLGVPDVGLGDTLPDPANIPPGCRFHPRCPIAEPRCAVETPPLKPRAEGGVECLLV